MASNSVNSLPAHDAFAANAGAGCQLMAAVEKAGAERHAIESEIFLGKRAWRVYKLCPGSELMPSAAANFARARNYSLVLRVCVLQQDESAC